MKPGPRTLIYLSLLCLTVGACKTERLMLQDTEIEFESPRNKWVQIGCVATAAAPVELQAGTYALDGQFSRAPGYNGKFPRILALRYSTYDQLFERQWEQTVSTGINRKTGVFSDQFLLQQQVDIERGGAFCYEWKLKGKSLPINSGLVYWDLRRLTDF